MSEVDTRTAPTRGRSTTRGGRGGFGRGGPRGGRKINGTGDASSLEESLDDQGEIGEMKKKYYAELPTLREMFPDWTDTDLVFALDEADGDITAVVDKITQGAVSQFAEVKKPKDRARSKAKDEPSTAGATDKSGFATRGGRGRGGFESARGGRGRGADRGRGGFRGGRGGHATTNGTIKEAAGESVPTTESNAWATDATTVTAAENSWDDSPAAPAADASEAAGDGSQSTWATAATTEAKPATIVEAAKSSVIPDSGAKKGGWAGLFAKPKPAPPPVPQKQILTRETAPAAVVAAGIEATPAAAEAVLEHIVADEEKASEPGPLPATTPANQEPQEPAAAAMSESLPIAEQPVERPVTSNGEELSLTPSKDPLTEANVEHLPDDSIPPATQTVASTTGSVDPRHLTPLPSQQAPIGRPPLGGFAVSANRLAGSGGRSASFQRRVQEQQEAVVMPKHAVEKAAVQFGSMGLNGEPGSDVDEEREEPETRQAPQHSPPSQPKASLPPAPRETGAPQHAPGLPEAVPTPKQAPGLPPASVQNQQQIQDPSMAHNLTAEQQMSQAYSQYQRYATPGMQQQQESGAPQQKPYDPFTQQAPQPSYDQFAAQQQQPQQQVQQAPAGFGTLSSAPSDYSQYYTSDHNRAPYNQYYGGSYGQQDTRGHQPQAAAQAQHDPLGPQRSASGFGAGPNDTAFASQTQQAQSRFAEAPGSGNNTPNPVAGQQQAAHNAQHSQHSMHAQSAAAQAHQQAGFAAGFPYGHPYYNSPYQTAYANQFGFNQQMSGYGGYPGQKGGMYGQPHTGYGMGSQSSFDQHSSSPANAGAFGQSQQASMRSASGMGASGLGGIEDYGRGSAQSASHQPSSGYGGMSDPLARSTSGYGAQNYGQQMSNAGGLSNATNDTLSPFNDAKSGPSPALGQPGRPGSAANSNATASQPGMPPQHSQHSGYGGQPGYPSQHSQYGGLGGLGSHQSSQAGGQQSAYGSSGQQNAYGGSGQQAPYGSYGGFGQQNYGSYGRGGGGWANAYGGSGSTQAYGSGQYGT